MNKLELTKLVRSYTRDFTHTVFREEDIARFINEGIFRIKQVIPNLDELTTLFMNDDEVQVIPEEYQHYIGLYASARLFEQDDRYHQASTKMNEFEYKVEELYNKILNGEVVLKDSNGDAIDVQTEDEYVNTEYFS